MKPTDLVEQLLSEDNPSAGAGLALRELGFAPLDAQQKTLFQGAGPRAVAMEFSGNGFSCTFVYDMDEQHFEAISTDAEGIASLYEAPPEKVAGVIKAFLAAPSERRLRFLVQQQGGQVHTNRFNR
jgi:hypothetical protein